MKTEIRPFGPPAVAGVHTTILKQRRDFFNAAYTKESLNGKNKEST